MGSKFSFYLLLFIAFLDFVGVGLVFPLFPSLLFDPTIPILPPEATPAVRGLWMGVLIALTPLIQFFASPILGSVSDQNGRKSMILFGLSLGLFGFVLGVMGVRLHSLTFLVFYRIFFGFAAATMTVVQAAIIDISTPETKAKNFGLYNMALGTGFTLGPFLGGVLSSSGVVSWFDLSTPLLLGAIVTGLNILFLMLTFKETAEVRPVKKIDLFKGIRHAKVAFTHPVLRLVFLSFFVFVFGWDFFMEFISVPLKTKYDLSTAHIGYFFAYKGFLYAFCTGVLSRPFVSRFPPERLLRYSMVLGGICLLAFLLIEDPIYFLLYLPILNFILAFYWPVASTYISNSAREGAQGEMIGIYHSVQALALVLSPLFSGAVVGKIPMMPVIMGGGLMIVGGSIFVLSQRQTVDRSLESL